MMHFSPSLVKYSTPVLISTGVKKKGQKEEEKKNNKPKYYDWKDSKVDKTVNIWDWVLDMEKGQTIEQILNTILIPREFHLENQGQVWIQTAISVPATRTEVRTLQEELKKRLKQRQANETGICPIREELNGQCFDELIRQVIISYKRRGLILACIRDQITMTIDCYKNLYESSIAFGIRKAVHADKYKGEMKSEIEQLEAECSSLQKEVDVRKTEIEKLNSKHEEDRKALMEDHDKHLKQLTDENEFIKEELENLLSSSSKKKKQKRKG